ncbi:MAG TPA: hypothetical protein VFA71_03905 [Terriglobales bacterium]|nr:hypothetical protein [Terriglobales bacterium]
MEQSQAKFEGWAVVEMFGHQREIGYVTTEIFGSAVLFRIDTPELPEREFVLESPELIAHQWTPEGTRVKRTSSPARSKLVGPGAIYAITPCTKETALNALESSNRRPLIRLDIPQPQLQQADAVPTPDLPTPAPAMIDVEEYEDEEEPHNDVVQERA